MQRKLLVVTLVLVGIAVTASVSVAAASWWWRGDRYVLPARGMKQAIEEVLTEHRNRLDTMGTGPFVEARAEAPLACIRGNVNLGGAEVSGSGFNAFWAFTGTYGVSFDEPFDDLPGVGVTPDGSDIYVSCRVNADLLQVHFTDASGTPVDTAFSFVAVGPVSGSVEEPPLPE